ncbi:MAG: hypothetical protein H6729_08685 [Deltaproteobacteria bacterium]|nr:hypothetical protein [Deltaproteobacteria bacterium]
MIARSTGRADPTKTDAELIRRFAVEGRTTTAWGTEREDIVRLVRGLGLRCEARRANLGWMMSRLLAGEWILARGDYFALPPHAEQGQQEDHYVLFYGLDAWRRFLLRDPADGDVRSVKTLDVLEFFRRETQGGWHLAVDVRDGLKSLSKRPVADSFDRKPTSLRNPSHASDRYEL